jgi:hypothetical protein
MPGSILLAALAGGALMRAIANPAAMAAESQYVLRNMIILLSKDCLRSKLVCE